MLDLETLKFKGIGRFVEEQTIVFDTLSKLTQIRGQNNNTKGSSAAGKSTALMALDYLFGVSNRPSTVLKSRLSDEGIFVEGTFKYGDKTLKITRGKKLAVDLDGVITTGSSSKTEEELDKFIGLERQLFRKMYHKRQKEGGFFLDMTPAEMNDFLTTSLGLSHYKVKIQIADDKIKELKEKETSLTNSLIGARASLKATQDAMASLGTAPVKEVQQSTILELKGKAAVSKETLTALKLSQKLEMETLELSRPKPEHTPYDRSSILLMEKQWKELDDQAAALRQVEKDRQTAVSKEISEKKIQKAKLETAVELGASCKKEAVSVGAEIKKIRESMCPTCEQTWTAEKAKAHELELLEKLKGLRIFIESAATASQTLAEVTLALAQLQEDAKPRDIPGMTESANAIKDLANALVLERKKENDYQGLVAHANSALMDTFAVKQKLLRDQHSQALALSQGQAEIDARTFENAVQKLKSYEEARTRHENSLTSLKTQEASYIQKVKELSESSAEIANKLEMTEELKRGLKSHLSCKFDETLETIGQNATTLIRHVPTMANATIQLDGLKETQDGKIKEEVNAVIHMDGEQNIDIRSFCGGERTALDLAIDLSVIDVLESKANKGINIFALDEPFQGMDTVCIEPALEVLKNYSSNKRLIIVDHNPEVKEMVESSIVVVRDGATSRIVQS